MKWFLESFLTLTFRLSCIQVQGSFSRASAISRSTLLQNLSHIFCFPTMCTSSGHTRTQSWTASTMMQRNSMSSEGGTHRQFRESTVMEEEDMVRELEAKECLSSVNSLG